MSNWSVKSNESKAWPQTKIHSVYNLVAVGVWLGHFLEFSIESIEHHKCMETYKCFSKNLIKLCQFLALICKKNTLICKKNGTYLYKNSTYL